MRFDVNASILFTELELLRRPAAAAAAGFDAVEMWWPFDSPEPAEGDVDDLVRAVTDAGVQLVGLNFYAGDLPDGDRGVLSIPAEAEAFKANVPVAVELAQRLGCGVLNALYGNRVDGVDPAEQDSLAVENLAMAADAAARIGATVVLEAQNPHEQPRYPLHTSADILAAIERVRGESGAPLGWLYDVYQHQRSEGNLIATINEHAGRMTHVQIADPPGRNQPGTGEVAWPRVFQALEEAGYDGHVGLEYKATGSTEDSFDWLPEQEVTR
ncbi:TIM barrel protein [soil metagenome]